MMVEISIPNFGDWRSSTDGPMHIVFLVHLWFASWSMLGFWSGNKLIIQDIFLLLCLMWSIHDKKSASPVLLALMIDILSVMLDIIILAVYFPSTSGSTEKFSAVIAIFNLLFRFLSIVVIYRCWMSRNDNVDVGLPRSVPASQAPSVINGMPPVQHKQFGEPTVAVGLGGHSGYGEVEGASFSTEYTGPPAAYGYSGSYQNTPALTVPRQELPSIPPSYTQHQ